jgi:hypothetical protein
MENKKRKEEQTFFLHIRMREEQIQGIDFSFKNGENEKKRKNIKEKGGKDVRKRDVEIGSIK